MSRLWKRPCGAFNDRTNPAEITDRPSATGHRSALALCESEDCLISQQATNFWEDSISKNRLDSAIRFDFLFFFVKTGLHSYKSLSLVKWGDSENGPVRYHAAYLLLFCFRLFTKGMKSSIISLHINA